jgi:predicted nuclease of predicted toxin-antitoxin system
MTIWVDAQLSPALAEWIAASFEGEARHLAALQLFAASDNVVFQKARAAAAVVLTKDRDFVDPVRRHGPPPQVIWATCGSTSNSEMREILSTTLPAALTLLAQGEAVVEIKG